ncbi:hypothetical protein GCM10010358_83470 [Streptomyces minutiscleroticus]|uniref:Uncharacterized protein n=1 Tax=Streptomyces minutiscleroticus TaxID=68238 RepID=A0A918P4U7_9ACTN|nr:hypothetical protein GCM10010358_83470 [Streptomyces minutiscleroticus]
MPQTAAGSGHPSVRTVIAGDAPGRRQPRERNARPGGSVRTVLPVRTFGRPLARVPAAATAGGTDAS